MPQLFYDNHDVYLWFAPRSFGGPIDALCAAGNPLCDEILNSGLGEEELELPRVQNELTGEAHASLKGVLLTRDDTFIRRLRHHVSEHSILGHAISSSTSNGIWMGINKSNATFDGNEKSARTTWSGMELFGGYDAFTGEK